MCIVSPLSRAANQVSAYDFDSAVFSRPFFVIKTAVAISVSVGAVTGLLPPLERHQHVQEL